MTYDKRDVTIIIPTKNEGEGLASILSAVAPYAEITIVVDGHSTDKTKEIVRREAVQYLLDHGLGRGEAVRFAIAKAKTRIVVIVDADGSHDTRDIPTLVEPIVAGRADLVIASRRTGGSFDIEPTAEGLLRSFGADFLTYLVNRRFHTHLTDILYSFRAVRRDIVPRLDLKANGFALEQEMIVFCLKRGYRVTQVPSREKARQWGVSKLKTSYGISLLISLFKQLYFSYEKGSECFPIR